MVLVLGFAVCSSPAPGGAASAPLTSSSPDPSPLPRVGVVNGVDNQDDPAAINFDEFSLGTTVDTEYASRGVVFTSNVFLTTDAAQPTSPVLSGTPKFFGEIAGRFTVPGTATPTAVNGFSMDVGYIDNRNSVEIEYFDIGGNLVGSTRAQQYGINEVDVAYRGVASFKVRAVEYEAAGFTIDNLIVRTGAVGLKPTRMAMFGDSYSSGEGLIPEAGLTYDCGTDLHAGRYREGTTMPLSAFFWDDDFCQTPGGSRKAPDDLRKRPWVPYENLCHRHGRAYPNQLRERFQIPAQSAIFVACSGATTENVGYPGVGKTQFEQPSPYGVHGGLTQTATVAEFAQGGHPDLITIGIGGNDAGFGDIIGECMWSTCTEPDFANRTLATIYGATYTKVRLTLANLRSTYPGATIVAFGYPSIVDDPAQACVPRVGPDEMAWVKNVVLPSINETIKDASASAGVAYADITRATVGHGVCSSDRWINSIRWGNDKYGVVGNESLHPNQRGHDAIANYFTDHYTDAGRLLLTNPAPGNPIRPPAGAGIIIGDLKAGAVGKCGAACLQPAACIQTCNLNLRGAGFAPGVTMGVTLQSDPVSLGLVTTDPAGNFEAGYKLPKGLEPGIHTVTLDGIAADGTRQHAVQPIRVFTRLDSRIRARFEAGKRAATVRALTVKRLRRGSRIDVVCAKGGKRAARALAGAKVKRAGGCPFSHRVFRAAKKARKGKARSSRSFAELFKKPLAPGTVVRVVVTRAGQSGRTLDARVRARRAPKLTRRCTDPGELIPIRC